MKNLGGNSVYQAVVFFDLDGTLMQDDKTVAASSIQAIQQLRANQILPVVAVVSAVNTSVPLSIVP